MMDAAKAEELRQELASLKEERREVSSSHRAPSTLASASNTGAPDPELESEIHHG